MITIEEVIEFFEQAFYTGDSWGFKDMKEAAAVVRAQHEEINKLNKEAEIYRSELIDKAFRHVDRVKELQEEIERLLAERENARQAIGQLYRERDEAYERAAKSCESERLHDGLNTADDIAYNNAIADAADAIRSLKPGRIG